MVLSTYYKQRIVQLYFQRRVSYQNIVSVLKLEVIKASKKGVWITIQKYKRHGTISRIPGSGRPYKITSEMLRLIEDRMKDDNETTATQLVKLLEDQGYQISKTTVIRARTLGWTFHGSRYCQMIRDKNKDKRVTWATENFCNDFKDVVWTDESMIQLENHRTFSYRKVNAPPKPKARPKNPYKVMVWAGISRRGATNICLLSGSVDSVVYQEVLQMHLLPFLENVLLHGKRQCTMPYFSFYTKVFRDQQSFSLQNTSRKSRFKYHRESMA